MFALEAKFIYLIGEFGAGKTAFVKELAKTLNIEQEVTSPSFNFMFSYDKLVHIDLDNYNSDLSEFEDYFEDKYVVIEWANKLKFLYSNSLVIYIKSLKMKKESSIFIDKYENISWHYIWFLLLFYLTQILVLLINKL